MVGFPHLKTTNTRSLLRSHISKRSALQHFLLFHISKQSLLHSHVSDRAASFVLAVNIWRILVLRSKTCALLRAKTSALLTRKTCAVLRARTCALFRANTKVAAFGRHHRGRDGQRPPPLCGFLCIGSKQSTCPSCQHSTCLACQQGRCLGSQQGACVTSQH